jgi:hypothetical protein
MGAQCALCQQSRPEVGICYLRVIGQAVGAGSVTQRWTNVKCHCCDECYRKAARIQTLRTVGGLAMVFLPILWFLGGGYLIREVFYPPPIQPPRAVWIAYVIPPLLLFVGTPIYIMLSVKRRVRTLLPDGLSERLRAIVGGASWGFRNYVTARRTIPAQEPFIWL